MNSVIEPSAPAPSTPWRRRNWADSTVRDSIAVDKRLRVFASGFEPRSERPEVVVMITAQDESAKDAARELLAGSFCADWDTGWRPLQLGDFLLRLYPERSPS
jgi:hypothetical protein